MGYKRSSFKRVSGAHIGKLAVRVYTCKFCETQQPLAGGKKPTECIKCQRNDFRSYDSTGEAGRDATLRMLEARGQISNLQRQVRFDLMAARRGPDGMLMAAKVGQYVADWTYDRDGSKVIEDYKGDALDPLASWKLRHMEAMGLPVKLTKG